MDSKQEVEFSSDDEIFFAKLSFKEFKKYILRDIYYKNSSHAASNRKAFNDADFKLIETNSEPNIRRNVTESPVAQLTSSSDCQLMSSSKPKVLVPEIQNEDSFLQIERDLTNHNLDNTLDAVDFILNNAPSYKMENEQPLNEDMKSCADDQKYFACDIQAPKDKILSPKEEVPGKNTHKYHIPSSILPTPNKNKTIVQCASPAAKNVKHETAKYINTPRFNKKEIPTVFRTPNMLLSHKKDNNLLKTPRRLKAFEHIASPIATYIKNSPQVPLVKDVHPKKPLPTLSLIPKIKREGSQIEIHNKEYVLPPLAYRSAKKTTVVNMNKDKWPQNNWPKKLTSSLKKPVVLKHDHRETTKKPMVSQLDSFADLTLHQADVSVCTQKIAFNQS